jgi:hypothetical protein
VPVMPCGTVIIIQQKEGRARAFRARCKCWSCPTCGPRRRASLVRVAAAGNPTMFITLTSNPAIEGSPGDHARTLVAGWRQLLKLIRRHYKYDKLEYLVVIEATRRGEPHLHVLARCKWIDQRWLSQQWERLTGAKIVDVRRPRSTSAVSSYVAKYVGKDPHKFETLKRYYRSKNYTSKPSGSDANFSWKGAETRLLDISEAQLLWAWRGAGWTTRISTSGLIEAEGPDGTGPPPLWALARVADGRL